MMRKLIAALLISASVVPAQAETFRRDFESMPNWVPAQAKMLYPQRFRHDLDYMKRLVGRSYFKCDYSTHTCESGYASPDIYKVFILVNGDDQRTVLGHFGCTEIPPWRRMGEYATCFNYDTGEVRINQDGDWSTKNVVRDAGDCYAAALSNFGRMECP
jgi:hypothetical protein